jgi:hypothetical protein
VKIARYSGAGPQFAGERRGNLNGVRRCSKETGHGDALDHLECSRRLNRSRRIQAAAICPNTSWFCQSRLDQEAHDGVGPARIRVPADASSNEASGLDFVVITTGAAAQLSLLREIFGRAYDQQRAVLESVALLDR